MSSSLVRTFAEETGIFGLNLFKSKRSTLFTVVWCSIILAFSFYTIKNLITITLKYLDEETLTFVQQTHDEAFLLPFAHIYFRVSTAGALRRNGINRSVLQSKNDHFEMNANALQHTIDVLQRLGRAETLARGSDIADGLAADRDIVEDLRSLANQKLPPLNYLSKTVLHKLCENLEISIQFNTRDVAACTSEQLNFTYRQHELLGFVLSLNALQIVFKQKYDVLRIRLDVRKWTDELSVEFNGGAILFPKVELLDQNVSVGTASFLALTPGKQTVFYVTKSAEYRNLNLARRPCSHEPSKSFWCQNLCESHLFYESHSCWGFLYAYQLSPLLQNVSGVRECDVNDYLNFSSVRLSSTAEKRSECIAKCVQPCSRAVYSIDEYTVGVNANSTTMTEAIVTIGSHEYPVFEERLANDLETFFGDFGGALGLWLGSSFASLIHIPLFLLGGLTNFIYGHKRKKTPSGSGELSDVGSQSAAKSDELADAVAKIAAGQNSILRRLQALEAVGSENARRY